MLDQSRDNGGEIFAGSVFHNLDRLVGLAPCSPAGKYIDGFDDLAVEFDVLAQLTDVCDAMISTTGRTPRPVHAERLRFSQLRFESASSFQRPTLGFD